MDERATLRVSKLRKKSISNQCPRHVGMRTLGRQRRRLSTGLNCGIFNTYLFAIGTDTEINISKGTSSYTFCDSVFLWNLMKGCKQVSKARNHSSTSSLKRADRFVEQKDTPSHHFGASHAVHVETLPKRRAPCCARN